MITSSPPPHYHFLGILSISRDTKPALASGPLRLPLPLPGTPSPATLLRWSPPPLSNAANPHSHSISYPNLTTPRAGVGHLLHQSTSSRAGGLPGPLSTAQPAAQPLGTWWVAANAMEGEEQLHWACSVSGCNYPRGLQQVFTLPVSTPVVLL